jgi:predicted HNH restriction endonuclease
MAYAYSETGRVASIAGLHLRNVRDAGGTAEPEAVPTDKSFPNELDPGIRYVEGARKQVWVNAFERDSSARQACVAHYGYNCVVCNFNFLDRYGSIGHEFIHVHHLKPMALADGEYELDPVADLRPVCPNCHAMLHRAEDLLSIDELRELLKQG